MKLDETTILTFSFESALHDALLLTNHEAIQFIVFVMTKKILKKLLKAKANPRYDGNKPLYIACSMGYTQLAVTLIVYQESYDGLVVRHLRSHVITDTCHNVRFASNNIV